MARKPILCYYASKDTFFIMADTIIRLKDTVNNSNQMYAWRNVMLHSNNMYSNSDSMVYIEKDSVIDFYYQPVIWLDEYQVLADKMKVFISDTAIERMELYQNSLIAKLNDPKRFDQTKGKNMQIYFANNDIERLMVQGNGQSIYYVLDDKSKYVGVNKIECTDIKLEMLNNKPIGVHYYNQANGKFTPIRKAQPNDFILDGFNWEGQKRDYTIAQFAAKKSLFR